MPDSLPRTSKLQKVKITYTASINLNGNDSIVAFARSENTGIQKTDFVHAKHIVNIQEIAERFGFSIGAVWKWVNKWEGEYQ